jgi:hypothetical protein
MVAKKKKDGIENKLDALKNARHGHKKHSSWLKK